jgi:hypothetical protein
MMLFCFLLCVAEPAKAQLRVCNQGKVTIAVVFAAEDESVLHPFAQAWNVVGWIVLPQTACQDVKIGYQSLPTYLGFAYFDANKKPVPLSRIDQLPDMGLTNQGFLSQPAAKAVHVDLCVHGDVINYGVKGATPETNCGSLAGGPYTQLTTVMTLRPANEYCTDVFDPYVPGKVIGHNCTDSRYYLNVAYNPGDAMLHITKGTESGKDADPDPTFEQNLEAAKKLGLIPSMPTPPPAPRSPTELNPQQKNAQVAMRQREAVQMGPQAAQSLDKYWAAPVHSASELTPQWVGQTVVVQGTVSRVLLDTQGDQRLHIWFAESPTSDITGCSGIGGVLANIYGQDFSGLMGKGVEVAGVVEMRCGPRKDIYIADPGQLRVVGNATPATSSPAPAAVGGPKLRGH